MAKKIGLRITKSSKVLGVVMISLCLIISVILTPVAGISAAFSGFWVWVGIAFILSLMDFNDRTEVEENAIKSTLNKGENIALENKAPE